MVADLPALIVDGWRPRAEASVLLSSFGLNVFDIALAARPQARAEAAWASGACPDVLIVARPPAWYFALEVRSLLPLKREKRNARQSPAAARPVKDRRAVRLAAGPMPN